MSTPEDASVITASAQVRRVLMESKGAASLPPGEIALHVASMVVQLMSMLARMGSLTNPQRKEAILSGLGAFLSTDCGLPSKECEFILDVTGITIEGYYAVGKKRIQVIARETAKVCCSSQ